jgi:glycosyltransferase involved in cell wall biosynthesis
MASCDQPGKRPGADHQVVPGTTPIVGRDGKFSELIHEFCVLQEIHQSSSPDIVIRITEKGPEQESVSSILAAPTSIPEGPPRRGPADPELGGISLIFPVYNESFIIEQTLRNYVAELEHRVEDLEVIVSEDGSTDDTKAVLERLKEELPIKVFMSDQRKGYQEAMIDAIAKATKPWLFIVDSDYQFAAIDFWRLEPHRRTHDVILGMKLPRKDPFYRIWLSHGYNYLLRLFFKLPYRDMDTGFRLIRRSVAEKIGPQVRHMSFFTAEFVVRAHYDGYQILEVPVRHYSRKIGSTTIFFISGLFLISVRQFLGILRMKKEFKKRHLVPLRKTSR